MFGFNFIDTDFGFEPYEERKVDNFKDEKTGLTVDTCTVPDTDHPFETGIKHPNYNDGNWVIVEEYDSKEEAQKGHDKWVKTMTAETLPSEIKDVSTSSMSKFMALVAGKVGKK